MPGQDSIRPGDSGSNSPCVGAGSRKAAPSRSPGRRKRRTSGTATLNQATATIGQIESSASNTLRGSVISASCRNRIRACGGRLKQPLATRRGPARLSLAYRSEQGGKQGEEGYERVPHGGGTLTSTSRRRNASAWRRGRPSASAHGRVSTRPTHLILMADGIMGTHRSSRRGTHRSGSQLLP